MDEFVPLEEFSRLLRHWWLVTLCIFLGGVAAFSFYNVNPPEYEASATLLATIDVTKFPFIDVREDLIQYNEDIALGTVEGVLRSTDIIQSLVVASNAQGIQLDAIELAKYSAIERRNAIWEVRYRSPNPGVAQTIVNIWVQLGYEAMLVWKSDGRIPNFVLIEPPTLAILPYTPIAYQLSNLLFAGCLSGLIVGILLSGVIPRKQPIPIPSHD
jgi:hypothetical protein